MPNTANFGVETRDAKVQGTLTDKQIVIPNIPPTGRLAIGNRTSFNFINEQWNAETSYMYYDVVRDAHGKSYIAIKPTIPAGTPLTDGSHWFLWSEPDAQLEELRQIVQAYEARIAKNENAIELINNEIDNLTTGYLIVIGDSFSTSTPDASASPLWHEILGKVYGLEVKNYAVGGAGFTVDGNKFETQLENAKNEMKGSESKVKKLYIYGGWNDVYAQTKGEAINNAVNALISNAKAAFTNADIILAGPNTFMNSQAVIKNKTTLTETAYIFSTNAALNGIKYIDLHTLGVANQTFFMQGLNEHPNAYGEQMIAAAMMQEMQNYYSPIIVKNDILTNAEGTATISLHNFIMNFGINFTAKKTNVTIKIPYRIFTKANLIYAISKDNKIVYMHRNISDNNCIYEGNNFVNEMQYTIYFISEI